MPLIDITDNDIFLLQCAVENMRAAPEGDEQRARIIDARWRIASDLERLAKRANAAERETDLKIATWMTERGYATGHGDTIEAMLIELEGQAMKRGAR